jgi:hypothetical protein
MIVSHLLLILHKKITVLYLYVRKVVAKFKGAEYFRKALYVVMFYVWCKCLNVFGLQEE